MASITKYKDGWRAYVRRRGYAPHTKTFSTKVEAQRWARDLEARIDKGKHTAPELRTTFADLVDAYTEHLPRMGRSKRQALAALRDALGEHRLAELNMQAFINYARKRSAGPVTVGMDFSYMRTILTHAGVLTSSVEACAAATINLTAARRTLIHLRQVAPQSNKRSRRPTEAELLTLRAALTPKTIRPRVIPMWRIILFAICTAMRAGEITRLRWADYDAQRRLILVRDRKHPTEKLGNDQLVPLVKDVVWVGGVLIDPCQLLEEQQDYLRLVNDSSDLVFPYNTHSIASRFSRVVRKSQIEDLRFHDLRHDAISRLFEAGWDIPRVAMVSGHRTWENLKRYTNLKPEDIHERE